MRNIISLQKMVEKVFDFHQNSIVDNMVVVEVADKTANNMDYYVEAAENMTHIVVEVAHKIVKVATNMVRNKYHKCKFLQLSFVPFWN